MECGAGRLAVQHGEGCAEGAAPAWGSAAAVCWARGGCEERELWAEGRDGAVRKEGVRGVGGAAREGLVPPGLCELRAMRPPRRLSCFEKETWAGRNRAALHAAGLGGAVRGCCGVLGVTVSRFVPSSFRARWTRSSSSTSTWTMTTCAASASWAPRRRRSRFATSVSSWTSKVRC